MTTDVLYQIRLKLTDEAAELGRNDPDNARIAPLTEVLRKHETSLKCLYDAFADYVRTAEKGNIADYPLYQWTKETIDDPAKRAKHLKSFTLAVEGQEVYPKSSADALEADLQPLVGGAIVAAMAKHDTNPTHNPQMPKRYRQDAG